MSTQFGVTALMFAAANGSTETATLLLVRGADIEARDMVRIDLGLALCFEMLHAVSVPSF